MGACLSPWDDSLLAVAGVHVVKTHRCDVRAGTSKPSNVMMLVSDAPDPTAAEVIEMFASAALLAKPLPLQPSRAAAQQLGAWLDVCLCSWPCAQSGLHV